MTEQIDPTTDFSIPLNANWRIGADGIQWMVQQRVTSNGKDVWVGRKFFCTERRFMDKALVQMKIVIDPENQAAYDALPATFAEFHKQYNTRSGRGRRKM